VHRFKSAHTYTYIRKLFDIIRIVEINCNIRCYINHTYATSVSPRGKCYETENVSKELLYILYKWWFDNITEVASRKIASRMQRAKCRKIRKLLEKILQHSA